MIREAIILAGGLGTRLRSSVPDLPKCMAPVAGRPFLDYLTDYLLAQSVTSFIFSLGYKHELIETHLAGIKGLNYRVSIEEKPLGTGGAIRLACTCATEKQVFILNGDTLFDVNLAALAAFHKQHEADCTIALKPMKDFNRYGTVDISKDGFVQAFHEKKHCKSGLINGGVYALSVTEFLKLKLGTVFSFEKDYLEKYCDSHRMMGLVQDAYFIDIGIPEDYERAQHELSRSDNTKK